MTTKNDGEMAHVDEPKVTTDALATASAAVADPRVVQHSPLPWHLMPLTDGPFPAVRDSSNYKVAGILAGRCPSGETSRDRTARRHANARFIVTACNAHADLLAALKAIVAGDPHEWLLDRALREQAIAAIAKVEGR